MSMWANNFIEDTVQCWGCPVFDHLFQIVSDAAAAVYDKFAFFCVALFCVFFAFTILNAVWKNMRGGVTDPGYQKTVKPLVINSAVALTFLWMGVWLPRFITTITFEPTAQIALTYTQEMTHQNTETVRTTINTYDTQKIRLSKDGFFRPQLRDTIIELMETTISQFQSYMKIGLAVIDGAFSWRALLGVGNFIKHFILLIIGCALTWKFFKWFFKFCCYFVDIIVAMTYFAFFFPLSIVLTAFRDNPATPSWVSDLGKKLGAGQFKTLINAIISLAACILTYTVIIMILNTFFTSSGISDADLIAQIQNGEIFALDFDTNNAAFSLIECLVMLYILDYITNQIPKVTSMVLSAFDVAEEHKLGDELSDNVMGLTKDIWEGIKTTGKTIISPDKPAPTPTTGTTTK